MLSRMFMDPQQTLWFVGWGNQMKFFGEGLKSVSLQLRAQRGGGGGGFFLQKIILFFKNFIFK